MVDTDPSAGDRLNVHVIMSPVVNDSRVIKEARALLKADLVDRVVFAALGDEPLPQHETLESNIDVVRFRLRTRKLPRRLLPQILKYLEWCARILTSFGSKKITLIVAHDLEALPVAVLLKWLTGAPLHYDAHELEVHRAGMSGVQQRLAWCTERTLCRFADSQTTVSDSIANWYASRYRIPKPAVVRNIPERVDTTVPEAHLREVAGLDAQDIAFLYVGAVSPQRGIQALIDTFEGLPEKHPARLVLLGPRTMQVKETDRIRVLDPVPHDEVPSWIAGADVGFSILDDSCLNHIYALPNKLFQYILAGVPVIASPYPEIQTLLDPYGAGWYVSDPDALRELLLRLDRPSIEQGKAGARQLATRLSWEDEAESFVATISAAPAWQRVG
ncbi:MAG: glycosyltransferase [Candidatus Zixiibacteriota bacterium]|nr:MAG: glycosyltransferase [candidate division Zixibacteria bacterium]